MLMNPSITIPMSDFTSSFKKNPFACAAETYFKHFKNLLRHTSNSFQISSTAYEQVHTVSFKSTNLHNIGNCTKTTMKILFQETRLSGIIFEKMCRLPFIVTCHAL